MAKHRSSGSSITENDSLSRGYDAGNYNEAYGERRKSDEYSRAHPGAYQAAYLLGYYSSYENHEIPEYKRNAVIFAEKTWGPKMRAIGIAVDPR
jgi:hypothetical protein